MLFDFMHLCMHVNFDDCYTLWSSAAGVNNAFYLQCSEKTLLIMKRKITKQPSLLDCGQSKSFTQRHPDPLRPLTGLVTDESSCGKVDLHLVCTDIT